MFTFPMAQFQGGITATWATWDGTKDGSAVATTGTTVAGRAKVCSLSSTTVLAYWTDATTSYGTACVGTITGDSVAWGTPATVTGTTMEGSNPIAMCALSSTQAIVADNVSTTGFLNAFVINVSGTTPSGGALAPVIATSADSCSIDRTSSSQAILAWTDGVNFNQVMALTVAASVVTTGTSIQISGTNESAISVSNISSTAALVFYGDGANSYEPTAVIVSISGTTLTKNTPQIIDGTVTTSGNLQVRYIAQLTSTLFGVAYSDGTNTYAAAFTVSGTTIGTPGSPVTVNTVAHTYLTNALCNADATSMMFGYIDGSNNFQGRVGTVSGTAITLKTAVQIAAATTKVPVLCNLDTQHLMSIYANGSNAGYAQVVSIV